MTTIPTTQQLYQRAIAKFEERFGSPLPTFGKVCLVALSGVLAALGKLIYLYLASIQKNIFVDTAEPEAIGGTLERFGRVKLGRNPFTATQGQYTVDVTGAAGAVIPALTTFKSDDDSRSPGLLYILDTEYTLTGTGDEITLRALTAGTDATLDANDTLTCTVPLNGASNTVTVNAQTVAPQDAEDIETYRQNIILAFRQETQGGAAADYRVWASDVQGVAKTYPYAKSGAPGEINLYVEATEADSTDGKGTPTAGILEDVEEVIELDPDTTLPISERGRRPLGVFDVHVLAVTPLDIDITITGLVDDSAANQTLIEDALAEMLATKRPYIAAADVLSDKNDILSNNNIINTILNAIPGAVFTSVGMTVDSTPETSYTFTNGNIPYLNSVTFA